jgi:hypothetical protein
MEGKHPDEVMAELNKPHESVKKRDAIVQDYQAKVSLRCRDAIFHAIRGLNEINDQSQRLWSEFDTTDCVYHLEASLGFLRQIREALNKADKVIREQWEAL